MSTFSHLSDQELHERIASLDAANSRAYELQRSLDVERAKNDALPESLEWITTSLQISKRSTDLSHEIIANLDEVQALQFELDDREGR